MRTNIPKEDFLSFLLPVKISCPPKRPHTFPEKAPKCWTEKDLAEWREIFSSYGFSRQFGSMWSLQEDVNSPLTFLYSQAFFVLWVPICDGVNQLSSSGTPFGRNRAFIFNLFMSLLNKHLFSSCYVLGEELSTMFTNNNKKWLLLARRSGVGLCTQHLAEPGAQGQMRYIMKPCLKRRKWGEGGDRKKERRGERTGGRRESWL